MSLYRAASASSPFKLVKATEQDVSQMTSCYFDAFIKGPQPEAKIYAQMFPDTPSVHKFFETSLAGQMQYEPNSVFLKAVDTNANDKMVGFIKWTPPGSPTSSWSAYGEDQDAALCNAFLGAMTENRAKLMGDRPHWFVELMAVSSEYQLEDAGSMLISHGCDLADEQGVEAYVNANPVASPLYERFGFEAKSKVAMPAPFEWYMESFMVRPRKD